MAGHRMNEERELEQRREAQERYRQTEKGKATAHRYWQTDKGRENSRRNRVKHWDAYEEQRTAYHKAHRAKYPERKRAVDLVNYYVRTGRIHRPDACETCGRRVRLHGHHHKGYTGAAKLDVVWLCPACHRTRHGKEVQA